MLKRFYSKRSGFTLVEIIIAFAIFAIMAAMICQILDLSVKARQYNIAFQKKLEEQEEVLSLIEKHKDLIGTDDSTKGYISMTFEDGKTLDLLYDRLSAYDDTRDGLNYFVSPVNYESDGEFDDMFGDGVTGYEPGEGGASGTGGAGSQASRMDTRITGTSGIANIEIMRVIKDTKVYAEDDPMAIPAGHTRYFISCAASSGGVPPTLKDEDVPYSQYRLYFYMMPDPANPSDKSYLDAAASALTYTDEDGRTYTKDVHKAATITKVGYLKSFVASNLEANGLVESNILDSYDNTNNKYTIEQMGKSVVRIGSPYKMFNYVDGGMKGYGVRFNEASKFYIEFEGDPHLTVESFGANAQEGAVGAKYEACPVYLDEYNDDGTPNYDASDGQHVNIYGAFLHTRHYND